MSLMHMEDMPLPAALEVSTNTKTLDTSEPSHPRGSPVQRGRQRKVTVLGVERPRSITGCVMSADGIAFISQSGQGANHAGFLSPASG